MTENATVVQRVRESRNDAVQVLEESVAYQSGWHDGRFGETETFTSNQILAGWSSDERLAYYKGHRDGQRIKAILS